MKHINTIKRALVYMPLLLLAAIPAIAQPLNGTYTIGGASPNYANFKDAATAISSNGISGPVIFNIRPGIYTGTNAQGILDNVAGTSATNTITIQPSAGRGTVRLNPTGSSTDNYVIKIQNTNYVTVQDLTLDNAGATEGVVIELAAGSSYNTITRCLITGDNSTSTGVAKSRIYGSGIGGSNNVITNDSIVTGSYAIRWEGDGSTNANEFSNNRIVSPFRGAVWLGSSNEDKVLNNIITTDNGAIANTFYGLYNEFTNGTVIKGNNLQSPGISSNNYNALVLQECNNAGGNRMMVTENVFNVNTTGSGINARVRFSNNYTISKNTFTFYQDNSGSINALDVDNSPVGTYGMNTIVDSNTYTLTSPQQCAVMLMASNNGNNHSFSGNTVNVNTLGRIDFRANGQQVNNAIVKNNNITIYAEQGGSTFIGGDWNGGDTLLVEKNTVNVSIGQNNWGDLNPFQSGRECKILNNYFKISTAGNGGVNISMNSNSGGPTSKTNNIIAGNTFIVDNGICTTWANAQVGYSQGNNDKIYNNIFIAKADGGANAQTTAFSLNGCYNTLVYNNVMSNLTTGTNDWNFAYQVSPNNSIVTHYNNIFYKEGTNGVAVGISENTPGQYAKFDYNNIYSTTPNIGRNMWSGGTLTNLTAWRSATGQDKNSVSYAPAFTNVSNDDYTPDATSQNCWSMNGRGIHIEGNNVDKAGNARVTTPGLGVPDLGAYEFVPGSTVLPPLCVVTPTTAPVAGGTHVYTFGLDTVATITWDAGATTLPATAPDCRQYTGTLPPGLAALNPTSMYFYTDINSATGADYDANIYYKEPWIGTIGTEAALHLAKKDGTNPWVGYGFGVSGANTDRNFIFSPATPKLNTYGLYTGIDIENNAGVDAITTPTGYFCPGTYAVNVRIKNNGSNVLNSVKIYWEINGVAGAGSPITYTTPIPVNSGPANSNAAVINLGNVVFGAAVNNFKIWTSEPNGVADIVTADDTLKKPLRAALKGTMTIGGTSPDFATVEEAIDDLNALGICGPVIFNIRPGTYASTKALNIYSILGGGNAANRVTFQSENGSALSVVISYNPPSWDNTFTLRLQDASFVTLKNISLAALSATFGGSALMMEGNVENDSIVGCNMSSNLAAMWSSQGISASLWSGTKIDNIVFQNNTVDAFNAFNFSANTYAKNIVVEHNTFTNVNSVNINSAYKLKFNYNSITSNTTNYFTGLSINNWSTAPADNSFEIIGNKVNMAGGNGMDINNPHGQLSNPPSTRSIIANNEITIANGTQSGNAGMNVYNASNTDIINNSINVVHTSSNCYAARISADGYPFEGNAVKNNAFINTGGGGAYFLGLDDGISDYNNLYATGTNKFDGNYGSFTSFTDFRSALESNGWDQNSISYAPGFTSNTDLRPDPTNPASWSLNGRAEQQSIVPTDRDGITRPQVLVDGVPDIGAYEFEPTALPPAAVATPATAAPGVAQVFTFGEQEVATVKWNPAMAITSALTVRQYSGRVPAAGYTSSFPTHQYFYTSITPTAAGVTYDFDLKINYMDIWMGTMPSEPDMRLAHQRGASPWVSYNAANSATNDADNEITANGVTSFGLFTGIEDGLNFSALIKRDPNAPPVICTGGNVTLYANPVSGGSTTYTYVWKRNGAVIPGATGSTYVATAGGDYTVTITGTQSATSLPEAVTITAPPMAFVGASGPLTYCTGGKLTLEATSPTNVISYQWQLNGIDIPGATDTTLDVSTAGIYTLIVANAGCSDTSSQTIVSAGPIAVNLGPDFTACEVKNKPFTLDAGYPGAKYLWSTGDTTQVIEVTKSGTYSVQVNAGPSCSGTGNINVTVKPLPKVSGINVVRNNNSYIFSPAGSVGVTKLLWIFSDGTTSTSNTIVKTIDGNVTVKLVLYNECGIDTVQMLQWGTGIANTENQSIDAALYPNPATEKTLLNVSGAKIEEVVIMNAVGQVVYKVSLDVKAETVELPVNNLAAGRYIVRASTTEGIISKPLTVQR